jgi:hypothetical protein
MPTSDQKTLWVALLSRSDIDLTAVKIAHQHYIESCGNDRHLRCFDRSAPKKSMMSYRSGNSMKHPIDLWHCALSGQLLSLWLTVWTYNSRKALNTKGFWQTL